jgi:drug/metabolite transporter (DMT)-like permease
LLGIVLGVVAGLVPGAGFAWTARYQRVAEDVFVHRSVPWLEVTPWTTLAIVGIGVPVIAATFAWLLTSSKVSLTRRDT